MRPVFLILTALSILACDATEAISESGEDTAEEYDTLTTEALDAAECAGYDDGYGEGYEDGYFAGFIEGGDLGYSEGLEDGANDGGECDEVYDSAYDDGYHDGVLADGNWTRETNSYTRSLDGFMIEGVWADTVVSATVSLEGATEWLPPATYICTQGTTDCPAAMITEFCYDFAAEMDEIWGSNHTYCEDYE